MSNSDTTLFDGALTTGQDPALEGGETELRAN